MVDDNEFVKRRHLSRGRPRKYEPSSSPSSCQSGNGLSTDKNHCDNCPQSLSNHTGSSETDINQLSSLPFCGIDALSKTSTRFTSIDTVVTDNSHINMEDYLPKIYESNAIVDNRSS
ncbi:GL21961 [Drosophila persimilis]|nr:GL21961 [Drosophila persimilis]